MVFCGKCGTENPDDNRFCNKCGSLLGKEQEKAFVEDFAKQHSGPGPVKVTEIAPHVYRARSKYLGPALVAFFILAVAALGIYAFTQGDAGDDLYESPSYSASYTSDEVVSSDLSVFWSGTARLVIEDGKLAFYTPHYSVITSDQLSYSDYSYKLSVTPRYINDQEITGPISFERDVWDRMQDSYGFLKNSTQCHVQKTFTNGSQQVETYKYSLNGGDRFFYVGENGMVYKIVEIATENGQRCKYNFILDGWRQM